MVLNIGVYPYYGFFCAYDTDTHETTKFDVTIVKHDDSNNIDEMYKEIKSKIDKEIGCVCLALEDKYLNEMRKEFIKAAQENGIEKIKIISGKQARFMGMLKKFRVRPSEGDVIWWLAAYPHSEKNVVCDVWEKVGDQCVYKGNYSKAKSGEATTDDLQMMHEKNGIKSSIIFAEGHLDEKDIKKSFPESKLIFLGGSSENEEWIEYALIMARYMHGDDEVKDFYVGGILQRQIECIYNDMSLIKIEDSVPLPYHRVITFKTNENCELKLNIFERCDVVEKIPLPSTAEVMIELDIDENGIFAYKVF